ncbi:hypothetical protein D6D01_08769 [Aureobasidium pullulans]|uniref:BTB domain-containing protein n=1 Tax=Aureobasidium pullulans TaxID=5580 RepID=A0A4S9KB39_AURPU|nr:hypothetical protein D6D01_08769 [Aureobasidium pullulans]
MSSKPVARQRIVPAIPHRLTIRRAKVVPAGKSDQQIPDDKPKSTTPSAIEHKAEVRVNGVQHEDAPKHDDPAPLPNGTKDDEVKQPPIEKEPVAEPVAMKKLAEDKEPTEKEETTEKIEIAQKMEPVENKESNGVTAPPRRQQHHQDAQARPFVPRHQPRQSETLVFGGYQDSSSASPANPTTAFMPPPPVPVMPPSMAPYDGYPSAQQYSSTVPPAPMAVMGPPPQVNGHSFAHTNGTGVQLGSISSSPSHTPSIPLGDSAVATPDALTAHKLHAPLHSTFTMPPFDANLQHLVEFVSSYFGQQDFADYVLEIYSGNQSSNPVMLPVHGIVIARFPGLLKLVNTLPQSRTPHSRAPIVHVPRSYTFQDASAFADAMRYVYGGSVIEPMHVFNTPGSTPSSRMRYILSYLAAGHCFSAETIVVHAYNIASRILSFNELEVVLFFAICGYCLSERCLYGPYADQIVWQALCLIVSNIFPDFVLDTSAPEFVSLPRLPATPNSTSTSQSRPDSRSSSAFATSDAQRPMSSIRFGSATPSNSDTSSPNYILSSALLSLPFELLKMVLEHDMLVANLGIETLLSIASEIVRERERRRVDACNSMQEQKRNLEGVLLMGESVSRDATGTRLKLHCTRYT